MTRATPTPRKVSTSHGSAACRRNSPQRATAMRVILALWPDRDGHGQATATILPYAPSATDLPGPPLAQAGLILDGPFQVVFHELQLVERRRAARHLDVGAHGVAEPIAGVDVLRHPRHQV